MSAQRQPRKVPKTLCHYTNKAGYEGILKSKSLRASTIPGPKNTHYGKGVYLTPLLPTEIGIIGAYEFTRIVFNDVTAYAVEREQYYVLISVNEDDWLPAVAKDPEWQYEVRDIWLISGRDELDISKHILEHGKTSIGHEIDSRPGPNATRDYAYELNENEKKRHTKPQIKKEEKPKKSPLVFIDGRTVARPEGWEEDFLYGHGPASP
ncbi:hypothetical protein ACHAQA_002993 [Verticillium albo-atrum]